MVTKDDGSSNRQFGLAAADIRKIALQVRGIGNINSTNVSLSTNLWTYVAAVWHASTQNAEFYINGQLDSIVHSSAIIPNSGNNSELEVGRREDGNTNTFDGEISEVRIWNLARNNPEIINNYNKALVGDEPGLIAYYPKWSSDNLHVLYFSQNSLPWGPTEYDHAKLLKASDPTMDRWGCAVTSAAMVLNFHGMKELTDGTALDPGSLNLWFKNNNGYLYGEGTSGWYSYINWPTIGTLTKRLYDAGKSPIELTYNRAYPSNDTTDLLNKDLTIDKIPDILQVKNSSTSSHFVVAKGKVNNTYAINDPEWNVPDLSSFNNNYQQIDRFIPSHTNLSYLVIVVNPDVNILVTDRNGNKTGNYVHNGQTQALNQIRNALYSFQNSISNPDNLGTGVTNFYCPNRLTETTILLFPAKRTQYIQ